MSPATVPLPGRVGAALASLLVVPVNFLYLVLYAVLGAAAVLTGSLAGAVEAAGLGPAAAVVDWMRRIGRRAGDERRVAVTLLESAVMAVMGRPGPVPPRQLLSRTLLAGGARLACLPLFVVLDLGAALVATAPTRRWCIAAGRWVSGHLHRRSTARGVLPGQVGDLAVARTHLGFVTMVWSATPAVMNNNQGILGGGLALLFGDSDWLGGAMAQMREYADYVAEKHRAGELGPRARMPFGPGMVGTTTAIVERYPVEAVDGIRAGGFAAAARAYWQHRAAVHRYLALYLPFTGYMMADVRTFFTRGLFDAPDAQWLTLCELAVMESSLPNEEKDAALLDLQATAPASIVEFEHYVGLVRPRDGTVAEKAIRRSAAGVPLDTRTMVPSILDRHAVHVAQSTNAEAYALRTFLWLYRDEALARAVNHRETVRKFGPEVAGRIAAAPRYPLEPWEVAQLTAGGPRPLDEVRAILVEAVRARGLGGLADRLAAPGGPG